MIASYPYGAAVPAYNCLGYTVQVFKSSTKSLFDRPRIVSKKMGPRPILFRIEVPYGMVVPHVRAPEKQPVFEQTRSGGAHLR